MSNEFTQNDDESKRYRHLTPILYAHVFPGHTDLHYFDDPSSERDRDAQLVRKIDCSLNYRSHEFSIEEKLISKWHHYFYCETESCSKPGVVTDGWMRTCQADYLNYMFEVEGVGLDCYIPRFPHFKEWFWLTMGENPYSFGWHRNEDKNQSQGRLVPHRQCARHVPMQRWFLTFDGICIQVESGTSLKSLLSRISEIEASA